MDDTRQLIVVHLSDIHFGKHSFDPPATAGGDIPAGEEYPTLLEKLMDDLGGDDPGCPVMFALTGDMAQAATYEEFERAEQFAKGLADATVMGHRRGLGAMFVVPGNHDVNFTSAVVGERFQQWTDFYNRLYGSAHDRGKPHEFAAVHDRVDELGAVVVTVNSSVHVRKGKDDELRGRVDVNQLEKIDAELEAIDPDRLESAIRVALIHHHPVLIPDLVEPGRDYDAVHNSGRLLRLLRRKGFHVLLHGHKHKPHVFTEDSESAYITDKPQPILIAAGGSAGSTELPTSPRCGNCYNQIVIKWHPEARQLRVRVVTRGLGVVDEYGADRLPGKWSWETLRTDDRQFLGGPRAPAAADFDERPFDQHDDRDADERRVKQYTRLGGYLPVVEVMPSLVPKQAYEARVWIVRHPPPEGQAPEPAPERVVWTAGKMHDVVTVEAKKDPNMCATFHYWGPMLIQARLEFEGGRIEDAHVYARMPGAIQ